MITQSPFIHTLAESSTLQITDGSGFTKISIKNPTASSSTVTITGLGTCEGVGVGNGITLQAGEDWTWIAGSFALTNITITTAGGTTAQITAT